MQFYNFLAFTYANTIKLIFTLNLSHSAGHGAKRQDRLHVHHLRPGQLPPIRLRQFSSKASRLHPRPASALPRSCERRSKQPIRDDNSAVGRVASSHQTQQCSAEVWTPDEDIPRSSSETPTGLQRQETQGIRLLSVLLHRRCSVLHRKLCRLHELRNLLRVEFKRQ